MPDFQIQNHGSVFLFVALTDEAREHVEQHIQPEPWQMVDGGFAVDHHLAFDLAAQLVDDGFVVA